ncbi:MAG: phosphatase PAP2 family protein [Chloroflexi bacterium]|nr:phosphatase PAP2 family protein [Chloroflexota bacterium]
MYTRILPWLWAHRLRLLILFAGVLIPLWIFGELAEDVIDRQQFGFDEPILLFMHNNATPLFDQVMLFFSLIGYRFGVVPVDILVFLFFLQRRRWGDLLFWGIAVGGAALLNLAAKHSFGRVRPDLWLSIAPETTFSFPSGHAMGSMALAAAVVVLLWPTRWRWLALILGSFFVFMVGLSRVYLGVHYPSDILAGWVASLAWVIGVSLVLYGRLTKPTPQAEPMQAEQVGA